MSPNITEIAKKQRYLYLLNRMNQGKPLTRAGIKELERYEMAKKKSKTTNTEEKTKLSAKQVGVKKIRKPGGGRKSKYNPDMDRAAKILCKKGFTDDELAKFFSVNQDTINNWKKQFPLFFESLKTGKKMADAQVEASLFQRAIGYSVPDVHVSSYEGDITVTPIIKHYPPDTTAQIFWLKNRQPKKWRDKQEVEHSGEIKVPELVINVKK